MDIRKHAMRKLSSELIKKEEEMIKDAINYVIGNDQWDIDVIKHRCEMLHLTNGTKIFAVDGMHLIEFPSDNLNINQDQNRLSVELEYRILYDKD